LEREDWNAKDERLRAPIPEFFGSLFAWTMK
jgi:hypothetical protein